MMCNYPTALGKVNFCPNEYSRDARLKYGNEMNNFKIGEQEIIECGSADGSIRYNLDNYPSQFIVYPSPSRECLVDGEWSRPRPICAYNISIKVDGKNL